MVADERRRCRCLAEDSRRCPLVPGVNRSATAERACTVPAVSRPSPGATRPVADCDHNTYSRSACRKFRIYDDRPVRGGHAAGGTGCLPPASERFSVVAERRCHRHRDPADDVVHHHRATADRLTVNIEFDGGRRSRARRSRFPVGPPTKPSRATQLSVRSAVPETCSRGVRQSDDGRAPTRRRRVGIDGESRPPGSGAGRDRLVGAPPTGPSGRQRAPLMMSRVGCPGEIFGRPSQCS